LLISFSLFFVFLFCFCFFFFFFFGGTRAWTQCLTLSFFVMVHWSKRIQVKINKGKRAWVKIQEKPGTDFEVSFSSGVAQDCAQFSQELLVTTYANCFQPEFFLSFGNTGGWTKGLALAGQALYHWSHSPSPPPREVYPSLGVQSY
jgi:hypothetical protein